MLVITVMAGTAAALCVPANAADQCPAGQACVVVHLQGDRSGTFVVSADTIKDDADQIDKEYRIRGAGGSSVNEQGDGMSIRAIIGSTGVVPGTVTFSQAFAPDGGRSTLQDDDFAAPGDAPFVNGLVPVVKVNGSNDSIQYIRPQRDPSDLNLPDYFQTKSRAQLDIYVHTTGKPLFPVLTASPAAQTDSNKPVVFTADVDGTSALTYDWYFGDGAHTQTSTGRSTHQYTKSSAHGQDSFRAYVEVSGSDTSSGRSAPITVSIGMPAATGGTKPGTGHETSPDAPSTGPDDSTGDVTGTPPSATDTPSTPGPGNPATPRATGAPTTEPGTASHPAARKPSAPVVRGVIIAGPGILSRKATTSTARELSQATAPSAHVGARHPRTWSGIGAAVTMLLAGVGAASETPWVRRRIPLRRNRA